MINSDGRRRYRRACSRLSLRNAFLPFSFLVSIHRPIIRPLDISLFIRRRMMRTRKRLSVDFLFALFLPERIKADRLVLVASLLITFSERLRCELRLAAFNQLRPTMSLYRLRLRRSCFATQMEEKFNYTWLILVHSDFIRTCTKLGKRWLNAWISSARTIARR